jgi:uncharacterized protein (DUF1810 family)
VSSLDRFKEVQAHTDSGFDAALSELAAGRKQGHWIWYVFPQLLGLGASAPSQFYGIDGVAEATRYLQDPALRSRLLKIAGTVADQARRGTSLAALMSSRIDVSKLVSSLTLFGAVAKKLYAAEGLAEYDTIARTADEVLGAAALEGYPPCPYTLAALQEKPR